MVRCIQQSGVPDCEFFEAANGLEVIEELKEVLPDLIITDINMPKCDGIDLVKRIKTNPEFSSIPVVVMSSAGNIEQRNELEGLGISTILSKPLQSPDVIDIAINLLGESDKKNNSEEGEW
jgi:CheY-like chemotaxis protein